MTVGETITVSKKSTKLSLNDIKTRLYKINPNIEILDDVYVNAKTGINFKCLIDGHEWMANWENISVGRGCPKCARIKQGDARRLTKEQAIFKFKKTHGEKYDYSLVKYINNSTNVKILCKKCNNVFLQAPASHWSGNGCTICSINRPYTEESIILKFKEKHGDTYIYDKLGFCGVKHNINIGCRVDEHGYFIANAESHMNGFGKCPKCNASSLDIRGRITSTSRQVLRIERPDLIKYLKNKEDADKYTMGSSIKVEMICPDCGEQKSSTIQNIVKNGFKCAICSDGISMPEKFCINLLKHIGVSFDRQKIFEWSGKKRYDFYIPILDLIIETHGIQHYVFSGMGAQPEIVQSNDNYKYQMAINNGINSHNYVVINCTNSTLEWFKENFTLSLKNHFCLSDVNWEDIWVKSQKSIITQAWDMWKNKTNDMTTKNLSNEFNVATCTIVEWLKKGSECGVVEYNPKEEMKKCQKRTMKKISKQTYQLTMCGDVVRIWDSLSEINKELKLHTKYIRQCAMGELESYGGFKWAYKIKEIEND
jgi:rubredoxin